jgi:hypothetical protein
MEVNTMMKEVVFMNEYDDVIITYQGNDLEELVGMISDDDVEEMRAYMEDCDLSYEDVSLKDLKYAVVCDYIREMLCNNIRENIITGTEELFRIVKEVM